MKQQVRINFLNWRPDQEPLGHDGLYVADNVLHETEGYKQVKVVPEADWTLNGLNYTMTAIQVRQIGSLRDSSISNKIVATLRGGAVPRLDVANADSGGQLTFLAFATAPATVYGITAFQVAELNGYAVTCAQAEALETGGTAMTLNLSGYVALT